MNSFKNVSKPMVATIVLSILVSIVSAQEFPTPPLPPDSAQELQIPPPPSDSAQELQIPPPPSDSTQELSDPADPVDSGGLFDLGLNLGLLAFGILVALFLAFLGSLILLLVAIFYCRNIQRMLKEIGEERRVVPHRSVWLMCIPFFNIIYAFIFYPRVSESIAAEYKYRGMTSNGDYEKKLGLALSILPLCGFIPVLNTFTSIGLLVVFIIYWYRISYHRRQFRSNPIAE